MFDKHESIEIPDTWMELSALKKPSGEYKNLMFLYRDENNEQKSWDNEFYVVNTLYAYLRGIPVPKEDEEDLDEFFSQYTMEQVKATKDVFKYADSIGFFNSVQKSPEFGLEEHFVISVLDGGCQLLSKVEGNSFIDCFFHFKNADTLEEITYKDTRFLIDSFYPQVEQKQFSEDSPFYGYEAEIKLVLDKGIQKGMLKHEL